MAGSTDGAESFEEFADFCCIRVLRDDLPVAPGAAHLFGSPAPWRRSPVRRATGPPPTWHRLVQADEYAVRDRTQQLNGLPGHAFPADGRRVGQWLRARWDAAGRGTLRPSAALPVTHSSTGVWPCMAKRAEHCVPDASFAFQTQIHIVVPTSETKFVFAAPQEAWKPYATPSLR